MSKTARSLALWGVYVASAIYAVYANWHPAMFQFSGPLGALTSLSGVQNDEATQ